MALLCKKFSVISKKDTKHNGYTEDILAMGYRERMLSCNDSPNWITFFSWHGRGLAGLNDAGRPAPRREYYLLRRHTPSSSPATGGPASSLHTDPAKMHQEMSGAKLRTSCA